MDWEKTTVLASQTNTNKNFNKNKNRNMENFNFCIDTNIMFGKEQIQNLPAAVSKYGRRALLTYGSGSIKKTGLYDIVRELLKDCELFELSGIAPNPKADSVRNGVKICREHNIDVILAVGGGSVIDCSKAIAAATHYDGDAWEMIASKAPIEKAVPIITVLTLAATGSEANAGAVISNPETNEKLAFGAPVLMPKASIMDPTYTFTVPANQTAAGCADIMSHLMEQYFVPKGSFMGDMLVESVMKTIIKYARTAMDEPDNYEARAQILWGGSIGDNATLCNGNRLVAFGVHCIEHELSAYYDLTHGVGLAILTPNWMRYVLQKAPEVTMTRFAHFGKAVWGIDCTDENTLAEQAIAVTANFFKSLDIPVTLTEVGIDSTHFEKMSAHAAVQDGNLSHAWVPLAKEDVTAILKMSL
jgi:alcohol dehydrogenase YqhD (iron-dependent ADH family)